MTRWFFCLGFGSVLSLFGACGSDEDRFIGGNGSGGRGGAAAGTGGDSGEGGGTVDPSLSDPDLLRVWANTVSAIAVYGNIYQLIAVADGEETFPDPDCPVVTDDGTTLEITGECTEAIGAEWIGSATVVRSSGGNQNVTLDGFGTRAADGDTTRDGQANVVLLDATDRTFELSLVLSAPDLTTTFEYAGHVTGDYGVRTVWSGAGTVTRAGSVEPVGTVDVVTTGEVLDDSVCAQPASGNTTIESASGDIAIITYDGSVDCDDDSAGSFSLNGEPQGTITGIACSITHGAQSDRALSLVSLLLAAVGWRRRRSRVGPFMTNS